jgi:Zn-dependent protease
MLRSWKLGNVFGIGIYVHWTFLLLPALLFFSNLGLGGGYVLYYLVVMAAVFGCVVLHELGHAMMARRFGIPTRDITLYPIGGVARLERMSEKPWEEFWIAVAGPAVNLLIAGLLFGALFLAGEVAPLFPLPELGRMFLAHLLFINLILAGFNLLPAFPMDGGRVLRALLALRLGQVRATQVAVNVGMVVAGLIAVAGVVFLNSLMMAVVAAFVFLAAQQELAAVYYREAQRRAQQYYQPWPESFEGPHAPRVPRAPVYLWDENAQMWVEQRPLRPLSNS